ncbi:MAG: M24 family metallopeptidase [Muricoprocola sp.]
MKAFYEKTYSVLDEVQADAILVSEGCNMRYLSGFRGATGYLYISKNRRVLATDSRYTTMAKQEAPDFEVIELQPSQKYEQLLNIVMEEDGAQTVAYEDQYMICSAFAKLQEGTKGKLKVGLGDKLDILRAVKEDWELEYLAQAEQIGDLAFSHMLDVLKPGLTEMEVAAELEYFMKTHGAENLSFETIIASGVNSSMPHAMPSQKKLEVGDFVTMDFGCMVNGYCSDMTRTVVLGKANEKQKEIYQVVLEAQLAALAGLKAGVRGCDVDKIARDIIEKAGYGEYFGHGLGHSVGLFIHEEPRLSRLCREIILPNVIETVEPGIYIPGFGGVRIEDMVVVTEDGYRNLAHSPKELIEL